MGNKLRVLTLFCAAAMPLVASAQAVPPPAPPPPMAPTNPKVPPLRALGLIPAGEERMFQVTGMVDITMATQEQVNAAVDGTTFSIPETAGFCLSAMVAGAPTVILFNGANIDTGESLFDADSGVAGLTTGEGRRSFVRTNGPVPDMNFLLSTLVGQAPMAAGTSATIFLRVYPETTPAEQLDALCGPFKMIQPAGTPTFAPPGGMAPGAPTAPPAS